MKIFMEKYGVFMKQLVRVSVVLFTIMGVGACQTPRKGSSKSGSGDCAECCNLASAPLKKAGYR